MKTGRPRDTSIIGQRFGRLIVTAAAGPEFGRGRWLCKCDCGKETSARAGWLRGGQKQSCGCLLRDELKSRATHGLSNSRLDQCYQDMIKRCHNPKNKQYADYGGRGIFVCDEWRNDRTAFYRWALANGYRDDLTIDREKNDLGYSPDNCRWVTALVQANNRRPARRTRWDAAA